MTINSCKKCQQLFNPDESPGEELCANCYEKENKAFRIVKEYLWENPGASVEEIAGNTEIEEKTIRKFIREGRFNLN